MTTFDLNSARRAADRDETAIWVGELLASPGSDNAILAAALAQTEHFWAGPISVPVDDLVRLAGPEDDALCEIDESEWEADVTAMEDSVDEGWEPPPLLAEHQEGRLLLQDGNHRYEALVRQGEPSAWVLVYFATESERDDFLAHRPEAPGSTVTRKPFGADRDRAPS